MIEVILVDENDMPIGRMEKLAVHQQGLLHRAISVYVFNDHNELLIQRRAAGKYHAGGQWSNTCCGHPLPGEDTQEAAMRRLYQEMGMACALHESFELSYCLDVGGGLTEHELAHVFIGHSNVVPQLNAEEADAFAYHPVDEILEQMQLEPEHFTPWFRLCLPKVIAHLD